MYSSYLMMQLHVMYSSYLLMQLHITLGYVRPEIFKLNLFHTLCIKKSGHVNVTTCSEHKLPT